MLAEMPFWLKLWNKGVDIAATVIASTLTATIIAVIATITWRWKRNRDLRFEKEKQRQHQRLGEEFAERERRRVVQERHDALSQQRNALATAMLEADSMRIKEMWNAYWDWLSSNQLNYLKGNGHIPREHIKIRTMTNTDHTPLKRELADLILQTELAPK